MRILKRYILKEFLRIFLITSLSFITIDILIEFLDKADSLFKNNAGASEIIRFFIYQTPFVFYQTVPVSVLLATLISLGILTRHNEITAAKAGGVNILGVISPIIAFSVLVSLFCLMLNEYIMPVTNARADAIRREKIEGKPQGPNFRQGRVWYRGEGTIFTIEDIGPEAKTLNGVTVYEVDKDMAITGRIDARSAEWDGTRWVAKDALTRNFSGPKVTEAAQAESAVLFGLGAGPDDFQGHAELSDSMSISGLRSYARSLLSQGYDSTRYFVDLHAKLAFPFVNIVMALIGVPFALKTGRHGGIAAGIGISTAIAFSYWLIFAASTSLGRGGILPPVVSAWTANIILGATGLFLLSLAKR